MNDFVQSIRNNVLAKEKTAHNVLVNNVVWTTLDSRGFTSYLTLREDELNIDALMLIQVHDELVFEVKDEHLDIVMKEVQLCMCGVVELLVPLEISLGASRSWGESH